MKKACLCIVIILILITTGCGPKKDKDSLVELSENESVTPSTPEIVPPRIFYGKLTEDEVRVRISPSLNSEIACKLTLGENVQVLCRTSGTYAIAGMEAYWYVIKRANGMVGWAYGYYIDFDEPVDDAIYVHQVDYTEEVKYEDRSWIGEYYVYRLLNKHKLPPRYAEKLEKTTIRITINEEYELYIGYHPDINESEYVFLQSMKQMNEFTIDAYDPAKLIVSFVNNYVAVAGERAADNQTYTYEIYYAKKKD